MKESSLCKKKMDFNLDITTKSYVPKTETWSDYEEIEIYKFKHELHKALTRSKLGQMIQFLYKN